MKLSPAVDRANVERTRRSTVPLVPKESHPLSPLEGEAMVEYTISGKPSRVYVLDPETGSARAGQVCLGLRTFGRPLGATVSTLEGSFLFEIERATRWHRAGTAVETTGLIPVGDT